MQRCDADWVLHCDLDFIFHENNFAEIRKAIEHYNDHPALTMWKYQFYTPDRYNLKSRLVIAVNKGKYGDRIRFDSGGDLCQPSLDGDYIVPASVPEMRVPFYNYDFMLKTKDIILREKGRFARAWTSHFKNRDLGGPDDQSAYDRWLDQTVGRYKSHNNFIQLQEHPKYMKNTIRSLHPEQFGYSGFGLLGVNNYVIK